MVTLTASSTKWLDRDGSTVYDEGSDEVAADGSRLLVRVGQTFEIVALVSDGPPSSELGAEQWEYCLDATNVHLYVQVADDVDNNVWVDIASGSL